MSRTVVLIGMRGAGKTSVGRILAERLGLVFVDADSEVEALVGCSVSDVFASGGESRFRAVEGEVVRDFARKPGVALATGGGCVEDPDTRAVLSGLFTVWLRCGPQELARRITGSGRPSLTGSSIEDEIADVLARREPGYAACASLTIETDGLGPEGVCDAIERAWRELPDPDLR
jgi:shikimate kinase